MIAQDIDRLRDEEGYEFLAFEAARRGLISINDLTLICSLKNVEMQYLKNKGPLRYRKESIQRVQSLEAKIALIESTLKEHYKGLLTEEFRHVLDQEPLFIFSPEALPWKTDDKELAKSSLFTLPVESPSADVEDLYSDNEDIDLEALLSKKTYYPSFFLKDRSICNVFMMKDYNFTTLWAAYPKWYPEKKLLTIRIGQDSPEQPDRFHIKALLVPSINTIQALLKALFKEDAVTVHPEMGLSSPQDVITMSRHLKRPLTVAFPEIESANIKADDIKAPFHDLFIHDLFHLEAYSAVPKEIREFANDL